LYLGGAGLTGLGAYFYFGGSPAPFSTSPSKPKQKQEKSALDPERFLDLKLKAIEPYNHNTSRFVFELPDGGAALSPIASLVVVRASEGSPNAPVDKKGNPVIRAYTPISDPDQEGELVLLIKKYETGVMSKYVHERLKLNDTLAIKGPITKFPYKGTLRHYPHLPPIYQTIKEESVPFSSFLFLPFSFSHATWPRRPSGGVANEFEDVALIGGGSGITPLYQLLKHALNDPTNKTRFTLLYANVSEADILLRDEIAALQRAHPDKFKVVHTLDKPPAAGWTGGSGYVSHELVKAHVPPAEKGDKIKVFICGTSSLLSPSPGSD
jgi:cytochrome-b5 reductase